MIAGELNNTLKSYKNTFTPNIRIVHTSHKIHKLKIKTCLHSEIRNVYVKNNLVYMPISIQNADCTHTLSQNIVFILYIHVPKSKISCTIHNTYAYVNSKYNVKHYTLHARHAKSKCHVYITTR